MSSAVVPGSVRLPGPAAATSAAAAAAPGAPPTTTAGLAVPEGPLLPTWLDALWTGLLSPDPEEAPAAGPCYNSGWTFQDHVGPEDQLSTQLYQNKQLQDTLRQKEEELARLQEENSHLRQFLNSALVKQLEEKTKKLLLLQNSQRWDPRHAFKTGKRHLKPESPSPPHEVSHPQKARRNLLVDFSAYEKEPHPSVVDSWVLRTLGLKDVNTINEEPLSLAHYNALTGDVVPGSFPGDPMGVTADFGVGERQPGLYGVAGLNPTDGTANTQEAPLPYLPEPHCPSLTHCPSLLPDGWVHQSNHDLLPAQTDMAFTASLSPHCNVKTHTFRQGQAFVRRDADGGWKLTWVPKQPD